MTTDLSQKKNKFDAYARTWATQLSAAITISLLETITGQTSKTGILSHEYMTSLS